MMDSPLVHLGWSKPQNRLLQVNLIPFEQKGSCDTGDIQGNQCIYMDMQPVNSNCIHAIQLKGLKKYQRFAVAPSFGKWVKIQTLNSMFLHCIIVCLSLFEY